MIKDYRRQVASNATNRAGGAHLRRVTAWCFEIAANLNLPARERQVLEQAVPLHQRTKLVADGAARCMLYRELGIRLPNGKQQVASGRPGEPDVPDTVAEVLQALHGDSPPSGRIRPLALILEQCDDLDTACEFDASISGDPQLNGLNSLVPEVSGYFGGLPAGDFERAAGRLSVFPAVAHRAFGLLDDAATDPDDVESLIASDQTLAGHIIAAANSAIMNSASRVRNIRQAVIRIGMEGTRRVICAALLRKLFAAKSSRALWNHSLDVAESAANIARQSQLVDCEEAFLAGLMHDVGKLVILNLPAAAQARRDRLTDQGCPEPIVEQIILGEDHASIGARVLRNWRFTEKLAAAVASHHTPERNSSPLCSVLYLAELNTRQEDALESQWREELARERLPLLGDDIGDKPGYAGPLPASPHALTAGLRFAAAA